MPGEYVGPSKAYLYAADSATRPQYLTENLVTGANIDPKNPGEGHTAADAMADAGLSLLTSSQLRWPKSVTNSIINILEAYRTPQIPVYRAWQTFKLATDSSAEAYFYGEAGKALENYGFKVTVTPN